MAVENTQTLPLPTRLASMDSVTVVSSDPVMPGCNIVLILPLCRMDAGDVGGQRHFAARPSRGNRNAAARFGMTIDDIPRAFNRQGQTDKDMAA